MNGIVIYLAFDLQIIPLPMTITGRKDGWGLRMSLRLAPILVHGRTNSSIISQETPSLKDALTLDLS